MIKKENQTLSNTDKNEKTKDKAPYSSPHLETHGNIRELTMASAPQPELDGAPIPGKTRNHSGTH